MASWVPFAFFAALLISMYCAVTMLTGWRPSRYRGTPYKYGIPYKGAPFFSVIMIYIGKMLKKEINGPYREGSFTNYLTLDELFMYKNMAGFLVFIGVALLVVWAVVYRRYREGRKTELVDSDMELKIKKFVLKERSYDYVIAEVKSTLGDLGLWPGYEPTWSEIVSNTTDLNTVLDIMLANRGKIRAVAANDGYDVTAEVRFLQVLQSTLGSCGVARSLFAIRNTDSGKVVRYAWAETFAAVLDHREKRVPIN